MLKNFLYLNELALSDYLSALEGGERSSTKDGNLRSAGSYDSAGSNSDAAGRYARTEETTVRLVDTPPSQFERLMTLVAADPELSGWAAVHEPDEEFPQLRVGALIDVECDIQIPSVIKALAPASGMGEALRALKEVGSTLGTAHIPQIDDAKLAMLETLGNVMGGDLVIVGETDSDDWKVAGRLRDDHLRAAADELDGNVHVVGKVSRTLAVEDQKPLLALPGLDILPRAQRRELEAKGPSGPSDDSWLQGPALMIEILAIYR
ncbi:hypothetical protein [Plantibacter sp. lyk4-40-MEA-4]|uniref:DUF6414 family protein n=1 Tax=Plantibacter sp. lyk4-40-MEA-4 TaxID=3040298 RepID=UPI00254E3B39|nr:hypothetical protein [Plantibacter sp. lyk4-40-MEA-4]